MRAVAALALALSLLAVARGDIVKDRLDHDDRSIVLVARPFGFESNGVLDIKVSNWKVYLEEGMTTYKKDKLGFFITTAEAEAQLQQDLEAGALARCGVAAGREAAVPTGLGFPGLCPRAQRRAHATPRAGGCVLDSDSVEPLFTFVNMEKAFKETNRSYYFYPGRIPPDAVRTFSRPLRHAGTRSAASRRGTPSPSASARVPRPLRADSCASAPFFVRG